MGANLQLFYAAERAAVVDALKSEDGSAARQPDIMKELGSRWTDLKTNALQNAGSAEAKQMTRLDDLVIEDQTRYSREMEEYKATEAYAEFTGSLGYKKKDPNAPKRVRTSWQVSGSTMVVCLF